ncbi:MAG: hypothetical protein AAB506_01380, partial [Patescibacteria group bacterium]
MPWKIIKYSLGILGVLGILGGFGMLGVKIVKLEEQMADTAQNKGPTLVETPVGQVACPVACNNIIDEAINKIPTPIPIQTTVTKTVTAPVQSQPKEYVIPLGSGTITENDKWVDIYSAQATINTDNYPGIRAVYFEAVMHIPNGQGEIKAKLVETTMPFYYGDIIKTTSGTGELVSTLMNLKTGNRNYRVQLNNQIGSGVLDSA